MKDNNQELGFARIGKQPPVTPLVTNRINKWETESLLFRQYVPFIKLKRTATVGKGSKVRNNKSDATHETLSINETTMLRVLAFLPNVIDIKTQYPLLPITRTLTIAHEMGVKHPSFKPHGKHIRDELKIDQAAVMTSDFLIDYYDENGVVEQCALALKQVNDQGLFSEKEKRDINIRNKLNIEAEYWHDDGAIWRLITTDMPFFKPNFARNLLEAEIRSEVYISSQLLIEVENRFKQWLDVMPQACFSTLLNEIACSLNVATSLVRKCFWKLMWQQRLPVDISKEIIFNRPLPKGETLWIWQ